jgi:outer membrane protein OmpA-like peptidoglycan-associated protein
MAGMNLRVATRILVLLLTLGGLTQSEAQTVIELGNPSFEGLAHAGGLLQYNHINSVNPFNPIPQWTDCGFKTETPPDLHGPMTDFFGVKRLPQDGGCFLGMVVRSNDTWERVSQKLSSPLEAGKCYKFSIYLSRDTLYKSATREDKEVLQSFTKPCVIRIHGGNGFCSAKEVLAETVPVSNTEWRRYEFILRPKQTWDFFELEAFYKTPVPFPYNGNILLDNASSIEEIECPDQPQGPSEPLPQEQVIAKVENNNSIKKEDVRKPENETIPLTEAPKSNAEEKEEKILKDLDADKIRKGQVIQIEKLFFNADETSIKVSSHDVLNEVYEFLDKNPKVTVEIGGHTNGKPAHAYCDSLSALRAESVADYLINKGVDRERIVSKGYGKRKPVASNRTPEGRRKNQRVEIKILSIEGKTG